MTEQASGEYPNPFVDDALYEQVKAEMVATGHFGRIATQAEVAETLERLNSEDQSGQNDPGANALRHKALTNPDAILAYVSTALEQEATEAAAQDGSQA